MDESVAESKPGSSQSLADEPVWRRGLDWMAEGQS